MRHGDEQAQVAEWAYTTLAGSAELADALGVSLADLPGRVWPDVAPEGTPAPWVVYTPGEGLDTLTTGADPRVMSTVPLNVRVITQGASLTAGAEAARVIYDLLHGALNAPVSGGGTVLSVRRTTALAYPERAGGIQYRHTGGLYQVQVN